MKNRILFIPAAILMSAGIASDREQTKEMFRRQIEEILLKSNS
jgi:hypothetical protein